FGGEHAATAQCFEGYVSLAIAFGLDDDDLGVAAESRRDGVGLMEGERTPPRRDPQPRYLSSRSNRCRMLDASRSPASEPAASFRRTVGSCNSLATSALVNASSASCCSGVSAPTKALARSSSASRVSSTLERSA